MDFKRNGAGLAFRATKDLDIVLYVRDIGCRVRSRVLGIRARGRVRSSGEINRREAVLSLPEAHKRGLSFYAGVVLAAADVLQVAEGSHLTSLPLEENISSLSAILLDNDYYAFIREGSIEIDGVATVGAARLIALKAPAWLDLTEREKRGEQIDSKTIKKHKNDVFRLYQILYPASDPEAPAAVRKDIREFISRMRGEDVDLKALGIRAGTRDGILAEIANAYGLAESE
jgi:hypothetical protein